MLRCHVRLEAAERSLGNNDIGMCVSAMPQCCYRDGRQPCISSDMDHSCFCAQRLIAAKELKSSPTQPKPVTPSETLRPRPFRTESPIPDLALDESRIHSLPLPAFDLALSCSCLGYASSQYWQLQGPGPFWKFSFMGFGSRFFQGPCGQRKGARPGSPERAFQCIPGFLHASRDV